MGSSDTIVVLSELTKETIMIQYSPNEAMFVFRYNIVLWLGPGFKF